MENTKVSESSVRSAEAERLDALLNICHQHYRSPCGREVLEMGLSTLGLGFLIFGIAEFCSRTGYLSDIEVREVLENLKSDTELRMGKDLLSKRNGTVRTGDLIPLIKHLEDERRREMLCAFDTRLSHSAVPA